MASARDMHTFTGAPVWYKAGVKKLGPEKKGIIFLGKHLLLDQPTLFARAFISACAFPVPSGNFILYFKFMRSADRLLCTPLRVQLQLPTSVAQMQFTRPVGSVSMATRLARPQGNNWPHHYHHHQARRRTALSYFVKPMQARVAAVYGELSVRR